MILATLCWLALQAPPAPPEPRTELDVLYRSLASAGATGALELRLDAYLPARAGPHPALLIVHGGAWIDRKSVV